MTDWQLKWQVVGYTLASVSFMNEGYDRACMSRFGKGLLYGFFIRKDNTIVCYQSEKENNVFGMLVARHITTDKKFLPRLIKELRVKTVQFRAFITRQAVLDSVGSIDTFKELHAEYLPAFIAVNRGANFIAGNNAERILKELEDIRLFTETMFTEADTFLKKTLAQIARKERIAVARLEALHHTELRDYFVSGVLPNRSDLEKRAAVCYRKSMFQFFGRREAGVFQKAIARSLAPQEGCAEGQSAFPGLAQGIARIVIDPATVKQFNRGDILIAGWTRPEFVPLMKKAGAIVTDGGGILSHAAIVARELKKPCIIGTKIATQVLKDGDRVEVDAEKGVVRKI